MISCTEFMTPKCRGEIKNGTARTLRNLLLSLPRFGTSVALIDGKKVNLAVAKMKAYFMDRQDRTHIRTHRHYFLKVNLTVNSEHSQLKINISCNFQFTICEVLNFLNVIFQIILLDTFFGGVFTRYGECGSS